MSQERALLAGGCFWGMEDLISTLPGILDTTVGYTGGTTLNPTYEDLKTNLTGHAEAIEILFDPTRLTYRTLLEFFFQIHNPCTLNRQGNDIGPSYRSAIFYLNEEQKQVAERVIQEIIASGKWPGNIVTEMTPASTFYTAEDYHQDYFKRNPHRRYTCHTLRPDWTLR